MRRYALLVTLVVVAIVIGCQRRAPVVSDADKAAIETVLKNYITSIEGEDLDSYAQNMAHDTAMVNFGAFGAPIVGWAALREVIAAQNTGLDQTKIIATDQRIHIAPSGQLAWATSLWDFRATMGEMPMALPIRCTWILEKRDGQWVILHFHKSLAAN